MCANSLDAARYVAEMVANSATYANKCNKGVLVGGMGSSSEQKLTCCQIQLIKESQDCFTEAEVIEHGYAFRNLFKPQHCPGNDGMLYRKGENLLIEHNGIEMVCKCLQFLCVSIGQDKQFHTFIECEKYNSLEDPDGKCNNRRKYWIWNCISSSCKQIGCTSFFHSEKGYTVP